MDCRPFISSKRANVDITYRNGANPNKIFTVDNAGDIQMLDVSTL